QLSPGDSAAYPQLTAASSISVRWLALVRPATLVFGAGPVVAVLALLWAQGGRLALFPALCLIGAALLVIAGANMLDEYLDYERYAVRGPVLRGEETPVTLLEIAGIPPLNVLRASLTLFATGALFGIPVVIAGGPLTLLLGFLGLAAAFL